jgi:hypothetical protein
MFHEVPNVRYFLSIWWFMWFSMEIMQCDVKPSFIYMVSYYCSLLPACNGLRNLKWRRSTPKLLCVFTDRISQLAQFNVKSRSTSCAFISFSLFTALSFPLSRNCCELLSRRKYCCYCENFCAPLSCLVSHLIRLFDLRNWSYYVSYWLHICEMFHKMFLNMKGEHTNT